MSSSPPRSPPKQKEDTIHGKYYTQSSNEVSTIKMIGGVFQKKSLFFTREFHADPPKKPRGARAIKKLDEKRKKDALLLMLYIV